MEHRKPIILAFCASSGDGKTELINALVDAEPGRFANLISTTSRPPRPDGEKDKRGHHFVTLEEMDALRARDAVWVPTNFPPGSPNWYAVQKADADAIPEGKIGCIAFVEDVIEGYRREGFTVHTVKVIPVNRQESVDRGDAARAKEDAARAAKPFEHTFVLENDFSEGGFARTLTRLRELVAHL